MCYECLKSYSDRLQNSIAESAIDTFWPTFGQGRKRLTFKPTSFAKVSSPCYACYKIHSDTGLQLVYQQICMGFIYPKGCKANVCPSAACVIFWGQALFRLACPLLGWFKHSPLRRTLRSEFLVTGCWPRRPFDPIWVALRAQMVDEYTRRGFHGFTILATCQGPKRFTLDF